MEETELEWSAKLYTPLRTTEGLPGFEPALPGLILWPRGTDTTRAEA